jgi:hypothetical protein
MMTVEIPIEFHVDALGLLSHDLHYFLNGFSAKTD